MNLCKVTSLHVVCDFSGPVTNVFEEDELSARITSEKKFEFTFKTTQNLVMSHCCLAEDGKEMCQELLRIRTAIVEHAHSNCTAY